jgi:hypothetical protein
MQRWVTRLVGVAVVVLALWIVARDFHRPKTIAQDGSPDGGSDDRSTPRSAHRDAGGTGGEASGPMPSDFARLEPRIDGGFEPALPEGTSVPPLPMDAPRQVRFGVVLVSYTGAQPSASGGRPAIRSRAEAKELAAKLVVTAQHDFHAAVQQGDPGSSDDVGTVRTAILEPAPEYILFTLPVDSVGGPIDTPRGYWIVKRLE